VVDAIDRSIDSYRLYILNAEAGMSERPGVIAETSFVGPGMRRHPALSYVPSRLSMVPFLFAQSMPPDVVVLHCAPPREGLLSLGIEVNVLPAAVDACRARFRRGPRIELNLSCLASSHARSHAHPVISELLQPERSQSCLNL